MPDLRLERMLGGRPFWLCVAAAALAMEGVALFYQYGLGYGPCILCIHVRIWVAAIFLIGLLGFALNRVRIARLVSHVALLAASVGLLERSWQTFATEKGISDSSCGFSLGLPDWFAPDRWLPWLFEAKELCGYTPMMPLGLSMAEVLLAAASVAVLISAAGLFTALRSFGHRRSMTR